MLNSRWDEQNNLLVQSHERVIQDLTEEYEQKLQEEQVPATLLLLSWLHLFRHLSAHFVPSVSSRRLLLCCLMSLSLLTFL